MAPKATKSKKVKEVADKVPKKSRKGIGKEVDIENNEPIISDKDELINNDDIETDIIDEKEVKGKPGRRRKAIEVEEENIEDVENNAKGDEIPSKKAKGKRGNKKVIKKESSQENSAGEDPEEEKDLNVKTVNVKKGKPKGKGRTTKQKKESQINTDEYDDKQSMEEEDIVPTKEKSKKAIKVKKVVAKKVKPPKGKAIKDEDVEAEEIDSKSDEPVELGEAKHSKPEAKAKNNDKDKQKTNKKDVKSKTKGKNTIKEEVEVEETEKNDSSKENVDENMEVDEAQASKPPKKGRGKQPDKPEAIEKANAKSKKGKTTKVKQGESPVDNGEEITTQDIENHTVDADQEKSEVIQKTSKLKSRKGKILRKDSPVDDKDSLKIEEETTQFEGKDIENIEGDDATSIDKPSNVKTKRGKGLKGKNEESHNINSGNLNMDEETQCEAEGEKNDEVATVEKPSKVKRGKNAKARKGQTAAVTDNVNLNIEEETSQFEVKLKTEEEPETIDKPSKVKGKKGKNLKVKKEDVPVNNHEIETLLMQDDKDSVSEDPDEEQPEQEQSEGKRNNRSTKKKVQYEEEIDEEMGEENDKIEKNKNVKRKPKNKPTVDEEEPMPKKVKIEEDETASKDSKKKAPLKNKATTSYDEIDFTNSSKNDKGQEWNFKIANWNVDGIRAWLTKGGLEYIQHEKPDILCLQEIKCSQEKLPEEVLNIPGYHTYYLCSKTDGYAGVAICTSNLAMHVEYGLKNEELDDEGRIITAEYEQFFLICAYVPNAGRKLVTMPKRLKWNEEFRRHVKELDKQKPVIICGDMNVAHNEIDLSNPKTNRKNAGFTDEERSGMTELLGDGFIDTFRHLYPDKKDAYTFWTYMMNSRAKNVGWRLDYFIISKRLLPALCDNVIRSQVFGSDHCPISMFLHLTKSIKPKISE